MQDLTKIPYQLWALIWLVLAFWMTLFGVFIVLDSRWWSRLCSWIEQWRIGWRLSGGSSAHNRTHMNMKHENIALSLTETQYFKSIQADIYLNDISFQKRALSALEQNQDLAGVSAKAVLPFSDPRKKPLKHSTSRFIYNIKTKLFKKGALKLG